MSIDVGIEKLINEVSPEVSLLEFHRISSAQSDLACAIGFRIGGKWVFGEDLPETPYRQLDGPIDQIRIRLVDESMEQTFNAPTQFDVKPENFAFTMLELAKEAKENASSPSFEQDGFSDNGFSDSGFDESFDGSMDHFSAGEDFAGNGFGMSY